MNELGMLAAQTGANVLSSIGTSAINYKYNKKLQKYTWNLNEQAAEAADARRRALYNEFDSPNAKIRQLKEAGLSPSLYADGALGSSIGSTSGAQGGVSGGGFQGGMLSPIDIVGMHVQEAQARKLNAEADELEGKNPMGEAKIGELEAQAKAAYAQAGLSDASKELTETNNKLKQIELDINTETKDTSVFKIKMDAKIAENQANKLFWEGENAHLSWVWSIETWETRKEEIANNAAELASRAALQKSQTALNNEQKKHIIDFVSAQLKEAQAHADNARTYGAWVEANKNNMKEQIRLRGEELEVEKWKIGVDAFVDLVQGGLFAFGYNMFRGKGTETIKENYAPSGASRGYSKTTTKRSR